VACTSAGTTVGCFWACAVPTVLAATPARTRGPLCHAPEP
jgi:hypothetical protein